MENQKTFRFGYTALDNIGNPKNVYFIINNNQVYIHILNKVGKEIIPLSINREDLIESTRLIYELLIGEEEIIYLDKFRGMEYPPGPVKCCVCQMSKVEGDVLVEILHPHNVFSFIMHDIDEFYGCLQFEQ